MSKPAPKINLNSELLLLLFSVFLVFILVLSVFNLNQIPDKRVLGSSIEVPTEILEQIAYWNTYLQKHPTYLPAYLEIAILENSYGNKEAALLSLNKAKQINPNSNDIVLLEDQISRDY